MEYTVEEFEEMQEDAFNFMIAEYNSMKFPLTVYTVIRLRSQGIDDISEIEVPEEFKKNIGVYWTIGRGTLEAFWGPGLGNDFTLRAEVQETDIDWRHTLFSNMDYDHGEDEDEIRLFPMRKIRLTGIADGKCSGEDRNCFKPLDYTVVTGYVDSVLDLK